MEALLIDLNDYERSGEGANGHSYFHKTDPKIMMKLNNPGLDRSIAENELAQAQRVYDAGIQCPKPGELVTDGKGCFGIRFERILGKKSFSRIVGDNPELTEEYARRFAVLCRKLHSTRVNTELFPNNKQVYLKFLEEDPYFTPEEKVKIAAFINSIEDTDTAIHGDLQFSNVITDGTNDYFIDLGEFAYGHPYFDVGMVYLCCCKDDEEFLREVFHMTPQTARSFWVYFADEYFGHGCDLEQIEKMITPYAGLKSLLIEHYGAYVPAFHEMLDPILK